MIIDNKVQVCTRQEWRKWLNDHHSSKTHCWLITTKTHSFNYLDAVEEALCFGWIDSTRKKMNDAYTAQRFSPRLKNSNWSELNKERVRRLDKLGLMTEEGKKILPDMSPDSFVICESILEKIRKDDIAYRNLQSLPDLYVRIKIDNIQSVIQNSNLFHKRLTKFIEYTRENKMYGQWNDNGRLINY